jgi:hypothetical protein
MTTCADLQTRSTAHRITSSSMKSAELLTPIDEGCATFVP